MDCVRLEFIYSLRHDMNRINLVAFVANKADKGFEGGVVFRARQNLNKIIKTLVVCSVQL
jgi:hypothetical protein